jgi:hypothetical protein
LRSGLVLGVALAAGAAPAPSPAWGQRLTAVEAGAGAAVVAARHTFAGAEINLAYRPGGQSRVALAVAAGGAGDRAAARVQLTVQFLVTPAARSGAGLYGGIGVAIAGRRGAPGAGYLAVLLGLEAAPGRRGGWYAEAGLAGGVRMAAGWRGRWFPRWWRP